MVTTKNKRALNIKFSQFADENDTAFKTLLIDLIIENLGDLEQGYYETTKTGDPVFLSKAYHKVKTTLIMLDDSELNGVVNDLNDPRLGPAAISHYKKIKAELTLSLLAERP